MGGWHMGRRGWRIMGPVLGILSVAAPAAAQVTPNNLPLVPGSPPPVPNGLSLNAIGEVLYDSNILRTSSATILQPSLHRDDVRYSPALTGTYGRNTGQLALAVNALVGRDFFQYNKYLDHNRYEGGGSLTYHSGSGCQVAVDGSYAARQAGIRGANGIVIDPSGAPADDVGAVINDVLTTSTYGANAGCGSPSGRLSFGGGYVHSALSNSAAVRQFGNSDVDTFSGNVGVGILRPGQLSLNGSYTKIAYPDRGSLIVNGIQEISSGVRTYRIGLSFVRPIGTKLSGSFGVSYLHSDAVGGQAAYNSPAYSLGLNYAMSQRLTFALTGSRDILPSITAGALFRVVDQALLSASYSLGQSFSIDANLGFIANQYKGGFAVFGEPVRRSDTTTTGGLGITYAPRPLYDVTLNVTQSIRTSDPTIFNYTSTRVGLTLALHY